jgi:hypothetical protein
MEIQCVCIGAVVPVIAFMSEHKDRTFVGAIKDNISTKTVIKINK